MSNTESFWDLNIFFEDLGRDEDGNYMSADVLTINPVIYNVNKDEGRSWNDWTDIIHKATFAESRYIRSVYPINEYGYDWTDSLENFLELAPPRLAELLKQLPKLT